MTRYYFHGDEVESVKENYYCAFCDGFEGREHFLGDRHTSSHHDRLEFSKKMFKEISRKKNCSFYRNDNSINIISSLSIRPEHIESRFYKWIKKQKNRDDPIGDFCRDSIRDPGFPTQKESRNSIGSYLFRKSARTLAIQAFEEGYDEFRSIKARVQISVKLRFEVFKTNKYRCQICGASAAEDVRLEIDHKIPVSKGGKNERDNLWVLCFNCNRGKGASDL